MAGKESKRRRSRAVTVLLVVLLVIACGVFAWSGGTLVMRLREYSVFREEYDDLRDQFKHPSATGAATPAASAAPDAAPIDFAGLRAENPDTVGWIEIPGTDISYPVVQAGDNETYLTHGFGGEASGAGAIFLDMASQPDMLGMHTIIYGHHMRDGSMFAQLVNFKDADFFAAHDEIVLYTPERTLRLTVIAAYAHKADAALRQFSFEDGEALTGFIETCVSRSASVRGGVDWRKAERLYSFVTCSYEADDMRTVVHAIELP